MSLPPLNPEPSNLGSLAQSARTKKLTEVRWLLVVVGILTLGFNLFDLIRGQSQVNDMVRAGQLTQEAANHLLRMVYLLDGILIALGALFVFFGIIIHKFPVPVTILSLVLYVGATIAFAIINPDSLQFGIPVKIIITIALIQAIRTAIAYEKEQAAARDVDPGYE